jgi:hypothetical protein
MKMRLGARLRHRLVATAVVLSASAGGLLVSGVAEASVHCGSGGTCFFQNGSYTSASYRNTSGVQTTLHDDYFSPSGTVVGNNSSAFADSTSSSSFTGVDMFDGTSCTTKIVWLSRGAHVIASGTSYEDKVSSFKLSKSGVVTSC